MAVPTGLTGQAAVALVRQYATEPTLPMDTVIVSFLNRGLEEVVRRIGGIRLTAAVPTIANQTTVILPEDLQDIVSANFSVGGDPTTQGVIVYPMAQLEPVQFMDAAAGFPAVGFGPPQAYLITTDASGVITMQLYPAAMVGQVNVYYHARPTLWAGANASLTNLDPQAHEAVVLFAVMRTLQARGRSDEAAGIWKPDFEALVTDLRESINRRTVAKSGQVRDVRDRSYPGGPFWLSG